MWIVVGRDMMSGAHRMDDREEVAQYSRAAQVLSAAQSLSGDSNRLKLEVGKFLNSVRAA